MAVGNKVMFVVNPRSGEGRTYKQWQKIERLLREKDYCFDVKSTERPLHACQITREALQEGYNHIIAVGGDGTINEVVNGFFQNAEAINYAAALSVLPMGTGSDFARVLPLAAGTAYAEKILTASQEQSCDIIRADFFDWEGNPRSRYLINVADVGVGCETCIKVNNSNKVMGGFLTFLLYFLGVAFSYKSPELKVEVDGELFFAGKSSLVAINNGKYFGGGVMIAPHARIDDGRMDVTLLKDASTLDFLLALPSAYKGNHLSHPKIINTQGRQVKISSPVRVGLEMDGETPGTGNVVFTVLPGAIKLLV